MFLETPDIESSTEDYASRFSGPVGEYFLTVQTDLTLKCLTSRSGASILDVGGGHAQLTVPLVKRNFRVTVTGSDESCRILLDQRLKPGNFTFDICDMLALPYDNKAFDYVLAFRMLPHVDRWQQLLAEMCRVAGTAVIFDYPDIRSSNILYDMLFSFKKKYEKNTRTFKMFRRSEISKELEHNNFSQPQFSPQFFLPMVIHRSLQKVRLSKSMEAVCRALLLTKYFGSPIIVKSMNKSQRT
jgi:2-polyprenyl-3-methyl-5-hydroxy-6-metoxy-1,4-benzoquinol methylase